MKINHCEIGSENRPQIDADTGLYDECAGGMWWKRVGYGWASLTASESAQLEGFARNLVATKAIHDYA